ncbi:MAG TPA: hypothetical protein DEZ08_00585 [Dehalococcoidia bacterium]|jgi:geranylgeranyl pyrophosphate synthase|nr:hypothetical protein [Dehalococcoidia bacterium]|tara:strand:+ start:237 stop:1271 length:1035 start_codon:yes stop_codon:yes gene_type:complete
MSNNDFTSDSISIYGKSVEQHLRDNLKEKTGLLFDLISYHFGWSNLSGDEDTYSPIPNLDSILCLVVSKLLCGSDVLAMEFASSIELLANFLTIHNDVQHGGSDNQRPSIWWTWGPSQAINAGDGLHALARTNILTNPNMTDELKLQAITDLDQACLNIFEGQYSELTIRDELRITEATFLEMVSNKSGSLTECAFSLACRTTSSPTPDLILKEFKQAGSDLGVSFQIQKDIKDIWGDDGLGLTRDNIMLKRKTFPLIHTLNTATRPIIREISGLYMKRVLDDKDASTIVNIMEESGSKNYAILKAKTLFNNSIKIIQKTIDANPNTETNEIQLVFNHFLNKTL